MRYPDEGHHGSLNGIRKRVTVFGFELDVIDYIDESIGCYLELSVVSKSPCLVSHHALLHTDEAFAHGFTRVTQ